MFAGLPGPASLEDLFKWPYRVLQRLQDLQALSEFHHWYYNFMMNVRAGFVVRSAYSGMGTFEIMTDFLTKAIEKMMPPGFLSDNGGVAGFYLSDCCDFAKSPQKLLLTGGSKCAPS